MRPKSLVLLILALGCGLVASIGISEIIDSRSSDDNSVESESILVAATDIERNSVLTAENMKLKEWPKDTIPEGVVRDIEEVEGRRPVIRITAGMPVLQSMLGTGDGSRPDEQIPKGYRVATVKVGVEDGAKLIRPGGRVDVQVYVRQSGDIKQTGIRTFLQDVSVFAVDADIGTDEATGEQVEARSVALLVTPGQAAKVTLASEIGKIRLVLRGAQDDEAADQNPIGINDLFSQVESGGLNDDSAADELRQQLARLERENQALRNSQGAGPAPVRQAVDEPQQMVLIRGYVPSVVLFREDAPYPEAVDNVGNNEATGGLNDWIDDRSDDSQADDDQPKSDDQPTDEIDEPDATDEPEDS